MNESGRRADRGAAADPERRRRRRPGRASACGAFAVRRLLPPPTPSMPEDAFKQKSEADALKALYGKTAEASDKVKLDAPEIAENGAVVPISVTSTLPERHLDLDPGAGKPVHAGGGLQDSGRARWPRVANRLKMAKTSKVVAVVESGGKLYSATKEVKVTVGGCGG